MKSPYSVLMEGYKTLADGKTQREEISTFIYKRGNLDGSFSRHSSGEKGLLSIATIIAFQDLINHSSPSGGLNLLQLDEIVESVDSDGIEDIVYCLSNLKRTVELITHANYNNLQVPKTLFIKENGITTIHRN